MAIVTIRTATENQPSRAATNIVLVRAKNALIQKYVRHPSGAELTDNPQGDPWPADKFTFRRLRDGDIVKV
jgi:hypothetical protein